MLYSNKVKLFYSNLLEYPTALLMILQCNSLFFLPIFKLLIQVSIFLLFIFSFINGKKNQNNLSKLFLFLIFFSSIMIIFLIFNFYMYRYPINSIFTFLLDPFMLITYFYVTMNKRNNNPFLIKIESIIIFLAISSLIFWTLANLGMHPNTYTINNWASQGQIVPGYFHLFYTSQGNNELFGVNILRNTGIFVESPMYSYILSIALLIELFIRKSKLFNYRLIILLLTIVTTTSTTGIIISILSIFYYCFIIKKHNKLFIVLLSSILIPFVIFLLIIILKSKIGTNTNLNPSFSIRVNDIYASFEAWKNHLIIGNGINNNNPIIYNMDYWRLLPNGNIGISTGLFSILAYGGILLGLFYIIPTFFVMNVSFKIRGMAIFSFALFIFTIISTTNIYILLISYFWSVLLKRHNNLNYLFS